MPASIVAPEVREGFTTVTPYLRVPTTGFVDFLTRAFDAIETSSTGTGGGGVHRGVRIGNSMIMIGEGGPQGVVPFRAAEFHVYVEDADTTFRRAIAAGAVSLGEPADRHYGERAGFVRDTFGNHWFIATYRGPSYVPEGLRTVTPFLHVKGADRAIEFLQEAFGARAEERNETPEGRIVHARLRIGDAAIELGEAEGADAMPATFYLYVADADKLYERALGGGATSLRPPTDEPYGDRVAAVADSMGNYWFIARPA